MYHAHGFHLNPNLYHCGHVCLSLINSWRGEKGGKWMQNKSTILQLLVSLQGLVLNDIPYFNEAGYEVAPDKMTPVKLQKSIDYNEKSFFLSCKTMLCKMRNPPKHFESFVTGHFQRRAKYILASIEAYESGLCLVGDYKEDGPSSSKPYLVSAKFKTNINKIYQDLKVAFDKIEKSAEITSNSESANNVSQSNVAATQSVAKIASELQKPKAIAKKQKGSKRKGVWKKFASVLASIFK
ncbi:ubiquitin-protein ligase [Lithospermum erythrorhizon]|uniref:Ubiquitin-protein ligase n=1 Tax=Lithospermum erythrorhizon TaxID=34254 RepID=A0AAV3QI28_LITER